MFNNQINDIMESAISKIKTFLDTNTVIGIPFETKEGSLLIPLTKVSVGFVAGGGEYGENKKSEKIPMAGGSGGGVCIQPIGFLLVKDGSSKLIRIDEKSKYDKLMEAIPDIVSNVTEMLNKGGKNAKK